MYTHTRSHTSIYAHSHKVKIHKFKSKCNICLVKRPGWNVYSLSPANASIIMLHPTPAVFAKALASMLPDACSVIQRCCSLTDSLRANHTTTL